MSQSKNQPPSKTSKRWLHPLSLPILKGPNARLWWSLACGGKLVRVISGSYENDQTEAMSTSLGPGNVFLDIGAHHGYFSLMASRCVGSNGQVLAFEPSPDNVFFLKKHVRMNRLSNVEVVESAVGVDNGKSAFTIGKGSGTGRLGGEGNLSVRVTRLDDELEKRNLSPTHAKIDVEGAELDVLRGAQQMLTNHRPVIFLSTHGHQVRADCLQLLESLDYCLTPFFDSQQKRTSEVICVPAEQQQRQAA